MLTRDLSYDLDEWRHFWQAETQRYDSPPIYMAYLTLFDLHVGVSSVPQRTWLAGSRADIVVSDPPHIEQFRHQPPIHRRAPWVDSGRRQGRTGGEILLRPGVRQLVPSESAARH
jgi:hypothetical protein